MQMYLVYIVIAVIVLIGAFWFDVPGRAMAWWDGVEYVPKDASAAGVQGFQGRNPGRGTVWNKFMHAT